MVQCCFLSQLASVWAGLAATRRGLEASFGYFLSFLAIFGSILAIFGPFFGKVPAGERQISVDEGRFETRMVR